MWYLFTIKAINNGFILWGPFRFDILIPTIVVPFRPEPEGNRSMQTKRNDFDFDPDKFVNLLREVLAGRKQNAFCQSTGLSVSHLSRILNGKSTSRPSRYLVDRIAGGISDPYQISRLYEITGYEKTPEDIPENDLLSGEPEIDNVKIRQFFDMVTSSMTRLFQENHIRWTLECCDLSSGHIRYTFPDGPIPSWDFYFALTKKLTSDRIREQYITRLFGTLAMEPHEKDAKITVAAGTKKDYAVFSRKSPLALNLVVSVMETDMKKRRLIQEQYLKTAARSLSKEKQEMLNIIPD